MRRKLFTLCSTLSLLLFGAVCVLWVRSYGHPRFVYYDWMVPGPPVEVRSAHWRSDNGATSVTYDRTIAVEDDVGKRWQDEPRGFQTINFVRREPLSGVTDGFHYRRDGQDEAQMGMKALVYSVGAPYWALAVTTAALPTVWAGWRLRAGRRHGEGMCVACGYDLRATPDQCPECGRRSDAYGNVRPRRNSDG